MKNKKADKKNKSHPTTQNNLLIAEIRNDTVIMKGYCQNSSVRIGFGEVSSKLLPPFVRK